MAGFPFFYRIKISKILMKANFNRIQFYNVGSLKKFCLERTKFIRKHIFHSKYYLTDSCYFLILNRVVLLYLWTVHTDRDAIASANVDMRPRILVRRRDAFYWNTMAGCRFQDSFHHTTLILLSYSIPATKRFLSPNISC